MYFWESFEDAAGISTLLIITSNNPADVYSEAIRDETIFGRDLPPADFPAATVEAVIVDSTPDGVWKIEQQQQ